LEYPLRSGRATKYRYDVLGEFKTASIVLVEGVQMGPGVNQDSGKYYRAMEMPNVYDRSFSN
jgi:hypothetical protein